MNDTTVKVSPKARKQAEEISVKFGIPKRLIYDLAITQFYEKALKGEIVLTPLKEAKSSYSTAKKGTKNEEK